MANDFIKANTTDTNAFMAGDLVRASQLTRQLIDLLDAILDRGRHLFEDGPPPDFTALEAACGIDPGEGQIIFDLINGTHGALHGTAQNANAVDLKNRIG